MRGVRQYGVLLGGVVPDSIFHTHTTIGYRSGPDVASRGHKSGHG